MLARLFGNRFRSVYVSRDVLLVVAISVALSLVALVAFAASLPPVS